MGKRRDGKATDEHPPEKKLRLSHPSADGGAAATGGAGNALGENVPRKWQGLLYKVQALKEKMHQAERVKQAALKAFREALERKRSAKDHDEGRIAARKNWGKIRSNLGINLNVGFADGVVAAVQHNISSTLDRITRPSASAEGSAAIGQRRSSAKTAPMLSRVVAERLAFKKVEDALMSLLESSNETKDETKASVSEIRNACGFPEANMGRALPEGGASSLGHIAVDKPAEPNSEVRPARLSTNEINASLSFGVAPDPGPVTPTEDGNFPLAREGEEAIDVVTGERLGYLYEPVVEKSPRGTNVYFCSNPACARSQGYSRGANAHQQRRQSGERVGPFNRKGDWKSHFRTHTNEKPFKCSKCAKMFADAASKSRHVKSVACDGNKEAINAKCRCAFCNALFSRSDNLKIHIKKHHRDHEAAQTRSNTSKVITLSDILSDETMRERMPRATRGVCENSNDVGLLNVGIEAHAGPSGEEITAADCGGFGLDIYTEAGLEAPDFMERGAIQASIRDEQERATRAKMALPIDERKLYLAMGVKELRVACKRRELTTSGNKTELVERLVDQDFCSQRPTELPSLTDSDGTPPPPSRSVSSFAMDEATGVLVGEEMSARLCSRLSDEQIDQLMEYGEIDELLENYVWTIPGHADPNFARRLSTDSEATTYPDRQSSADERMRYAGAFLGDDDLTLPIRTPSTSLVASSNRIIETDDREGPAELSISKDDHAQNDGASRNTSRY